MVVFTKEFGTLDPHLSIVWDKVPKKNVFFTPSLIKGYYHTSRHKSYKKYELCNLNNLYKLYTFIL